MNADAKIWKILVNQIQQYVKRCIVIKLDSFQEL